MADATTEALYIERFGDIDCRTLSGCDFSQSTDRERYFRDKVYEKTCFHQMRFVIEACRRLNCPEIPAAKRGGANGFIFFQGQILSANCEHHF